MCKTIYIQNTICIAVHLFLLIRHTDFVFNMNVYMYMDQSYAHTHTQTCIAWQADSIDNHTDTVFFRIWLIRGLRNCGLPRWSGGNEGEPESRRLFQGVRKAVQRNQGANRFLHAIYDFAVFYNPDHSKVHLDSITICLYRRIWQLCIQNSIETIAVDTFASLLSSRIFQNCNQNHAVFFVIRMSMPESPSKLPLKFLSSNLC